LGLGLWFRVFLVVQSVVGYFSMVHIGCNFQVLRVGGGVHWDYILRL